MRDIVTVAAPGFEGTQDRASRDELYLGLKKRLFKVGKQKKGDQASLNP